MGEKTVSLQDKIINYVLYGFIALIVFIVITILYIPSLSKSVFGFSTHTYDKGVDESLDESGLFVVKKNKAFADVDKGDMIAFELDDNQFRGFRIYTVFSNEDGIIRVRNSNSGMTYQWEIHEDEYLGMVVSTIPNLGSIVGFFGSFFGIFVLVLNIGVITAVVVILKKEKHKASALQENKQSNDATDA